MHVVRKNCAFSFTKGVHLVLQCFFVTAVAAVLRAFNLAKTFKKDNSSP
jgi:hypothetical protein